MTATTTSRPIGATILALILGWLAIAGFGNAVVWRTAMESFRELETSPIRRFLEAMSRPQFTVVALAYGATALVACVGLWRMRPWMAKAFVAWAIAAIAFGVWMIFAMPDELLLGGKVAGAALVIFLGALLWACHGYVRNISPRGDQDE